MNNFIWITTEKEFLHNYLMAPEEVDFLKDSHRHIFKFKIWIEVEHNDRDIEFFIFKRYINSVLDTFSFNLGQMSCEMLSDAMCEKIKTEFPNRDINIEVSEDGENGSYKTYPKS